MMHRTLEKHDPTKETLEASNYGIFIVNLYKFHKTVFLCLIGYLASVLYRFRAFIIIITKFDFCRDISFGCLIAYVHEINSVINY